MEHKKNLNRQLLKRIMFCASYEQYCKLVTAGLRTISRAAGNTRFALCGVTWLHSSSVFQLSFSAGVTVLCPEIPHERKAWERWLQAFYDRISTITNSLKFLQILPEEWKH